jgi:hypothetical protein
MGTAEPAAAVSLTAGDSLTLGYVTPPEPSSDAQEVAWINFMTDLASGGSGTSSGSAVTRTTNSLCGFGNGTAGSGTCPDATTTGESSNTTGANTVNFGSGTYLYLLAKYDGPNDRDVVWYVSGLTGDNTIPTSDNGYGLSHWALFNPTTPTTTTTTTTTTGPPPSVPEPSTLMLLGSALGFVATRLRRRKS